MDLIVNAKERKMTSLNTNKEERGRIGLRRAGTRDQVKNEGGKVASPWGIPGIKSLKKGTRPRKGRGETAAAPESPHKGLFGGGRMFVTDVSGR